MGNDEFLDGLSPAALKRLQEYNNELTKTVAGVKEVNAMAIGIKTPSGSDSAVKALNTQLLQREATIKNLQSQLTKLAAVQNTVTTSATRQKNITVQQSEANRILRQEQTQLFRANTLLNGAYAKASTQLLILKKNIKDAIILHGEESVQVKRLSAEFETLNGRVRKADEIAGDFQRNVGNYSGGIAKGFSSIFSQVRQLAYILPGIGIAGIFSLALDPLFDWIKGLDLFKGKVDAVKESQKQLNEINAEGQKNAVEETIRLKSLLEIAKDTTLTMKQRLVAVKELQDTYPAYFGNLKQEEILAGNTAKAEKELTEAILSRAKANAAVGKITENQGKIIDLEEKRLELIGDLSSAEAQASRDQQRAMKGNEAAAISNLQSSNRIAAARKRIKDVEKEINDLMFINNRLTSYAIEKQKEAILLDYKSIKAKKERQELDKSESNKYGREISDLEREKKLINDRFINEKEYAEEKIRLSREIQRVDIKIATTTFLEKLRLHKNSLDLQQIDANEYRTATEKAELESEERILKIKKDNFNAFLEYRKKYGRPAEEEIYGQGTTFLPTEQLDALVNSFDKVSKKSDDAKKKVDEFFKSFQEDLFSEVGLPTLFKYLDGEFDKFIDTWEGKFEVITQIAQEAFTQIAELSNQRFQREYEQLQQEKEIALLFAGESATAREEIERQAEQKRQAIARREFNSKKQQALFNIAIDTAQAIVATLARTPLPQGLPFVIATGALGAAQAAIVLSQQAPQFWKGTDNAPEGWAWTQEKGREIITDKSGKIKSTGSDKGAQLTWLNKGDKVKTASETMDYLMFNNNLNNILTGNQIGGPVVEVNNPNIDLTPVINAINDKETASINIDKSGINFYVKNGHSIKQDMNNRVNFRGKKV